MNQEKYKDALLYSNKALDMFLKINNKKEIGGAYINIGNVYFNQYEADNALLFYKKAEKICLEINDNFNLGLIYNNIGSVYAEDKKDKVNGLKYLKKALQLKIANNSTNEIIFQHTNLADFYTNDNDFINAEYHLKKAERMALRSNNKVELKQIYSNYANMYAKKNDFKSALFNYKLHSKYKDSILNIESLKSVKELETKYQTTKKEKLLLEKEAEAKQKNGLLIGISLLALFIGIISFLIYRQQKIKNQQQEQEFKLKSAISQIETQNKLQEQRLNISRDLHDNIGSQLTFIISSVDNVKYAFDIDNPKLDDKLTNISSFAKETIVELRDTIWAMNSNEITFEDLESRINNFIEKAKEVKGEIQFSFETDVELKDTKLTSVEGMNIYRTIQEAVNNAIKYAEASTISIVAKKLETQIQIMIQDNGIGFDEATIQKGNGLQNMQKRIEDIGGEFSLSSSNKGTEICVFVNN
jgi:signal transduction histidine kinase